MRKHPTFARAIAALLVVSALPAYGARGKADFTTVVALGDSLTVGVVNQATVITHQQYSWPAVLARQVGLRTDCVTDAPDCFQQAYISEPGILPELVLNSISPVSIGVKPGLGAPLNSGWPRPFNNLAVDGAEVADAIAVSGEGNERLSAPIVLRNLGSMVDQAVRLNPTFILMWFGADDFFGTLQRANPAGLTPIADFVRDYGNVLDRLTAGAPNAGFVVGNLPADVTKVPLVNLLPTVLVNPATGQPLLDPAGRPIPLIGHLGGTTFGPLPPGSAILFTAAPLLARGFGIPAALAPFLPPLPDIGKPLPDEAVLTVAEIKQFNDRIAAYNSAIASLAAAKDIPVVDINSFFTRAAAGIHVGPFVFNLNYLTGGLISIDSAHPTDIGYTLIANEFIRTVNAAYKTKIPVASIAPFLSNNGAFFGEDSRLLDPSTIQISPEALDVLMAPIATPPAKGRRRSVQ
ncbi:MAG TPA: SGNH/GDSL hydrolase family protein [Thermoanaerobaculia bacterium]|nr:SGNH/GDSL hydrolase family protein [Thermoanaerobaculia bacterium]